jgi:hypothetical protein
MVRYMNEMRRSMIISMRWKIKELIMIWVSSIIKAPLLHSLATEAELIQVTSMATKHTNKSFLSWLGCFFPYLSLGIERWLWIGWVVSFGRFECFVLLVVVGARNKLGSTLLTIVLTSLKANTQFVCGICCTLFHMVQVILNHLLTQFGSLKTCKQISNFLFKLRVLFGIMQKLTLKSTSIFTRG